MKLSEHLEALAAILRRESVRHGRFVLASGRVSDYYLDCRRTTLHPEGAWLVGRLLLERILARGWSPGGVGGLTLGADPVATAVAIVSHLEGRPIPAFLVRKQVKDHGTGQRIENAPPQGSAVVIVEDVVTSGGSALQACDACVEAGLEPLGVLAVVDREEGGREALAARGLELDALFTARSLL
ncbi:MAG: orotate phosphoribosyltransferase [Acidobacteriota bacterium]